MHKDLVSVIIPMYNAQKFIEKCIRSIQTQTYSDLEILVVDDESTDEGPAIVEKMADEDERIQLLKVENGNAAVARNGGLDAMSGEYFTFVDADDYVSPDYIEKLKKRMDETGANLVITGRKEYRLNPDGTYTLTRELVPGNYERFSHEEWAMRFGEAWGKLYRRDFYDRYGCKFISEGANAFGEDMPHSLFHHCMCENIAMLSESNYFYILHNESTMSKYQKSRNKKMPFSSLEQTIRQIADLGGPKNGRDYYEWYVIRMLATFTDLTRGRSKECISELNQYIDHIIRTYFPDVKKNRLIRLSAKVEVPKMQQVAVVLLVRLYWMKMLSPFLNVYCRI
ncbi:MAG: glycosyltransferase family 2 protein [Clostridiales bacterium]|nr:glycosyltransferase family 2 protein [Clostridiales bacterium]